MNRRSDDYYRDLESRLRELLTEVSDLVAQEQFIEVEQFIVHAEYGLALTWLAGSLIDGEAVVPELVRSHIVDAADAMGIRDELPEAIRVTSPEV